MRLRAAWKSEKRKSFGGATGGATERGGGVVSGVVVPIVSELARCHWAAARLMQRERAYPHACYQLLFTMPFSPRAQPLSSIR